MRDGTLSNGFHFSVDESIADDYEILELIGEVDENPARITKLMRAVLGDDQLKALKEHLRQENGRVTISAMTAAMTELFRSINSLKN